MTGEDRSPALRAHLNTSRKSFTDFVPPETYVAVRMRVPCCGSELVSNKSQKILDTSQGHDTPSFTTEGVRLVLFTSGEGITIEIRIRDDSIILDCCTGHTHWQL